MKCVSFATLGGLLLALALACGGGGPLPPTQSDWAGKWVAADGTDVQIFLNGGGSYHGSNTNIDGGSATIDPNSLTIGFGPISKSFIIDAPPTNNNGVWTVTLDGIVYTKQ